MPLPSIELNVGGQKNVGQKYECALWDCWGTKKMCPRIGSENRNQMNDGKHAVTRSVRFFCPNRNASGGRRALALQLIGERDGLC